MLETLDINGKQYSIIKLLGKGKDRISKILDIDKEKERILKEYWSKTPVFLDYVKTHSK